MAVRLTKHLFLRYFSFFSKIDSSIPRLFYYLHIGKINDHLTKQRFEADKILPTYFNEGEENLLAFGVYDESKTTKFLSRGLSEPVVKLRLPRVGERCPISGNRTVR